MTTVWTKEQMPSSQEMQEQFDILFAFADPTRIHVLHILREKDRNVSDILKRLTGVSQPNLSKHLNVLHAMDLLTREKRGREVFYGLSEGVESFLQGLARWQKTYGPTAPPPPSNPSAAVPSTMQTAASVRPPTPPTILSAPNAVSEDSETPI